MLTLINKQWPTFIDTIIHIVLSALSSRPPKGTKSHWEPKPAALSILHPLCCYSLWQWLPLFSLNLMAESMAAVQLLIILLRSRPFSFSLQEKTILEEAILSFLLLWHIPLEDWSILLVTSSNDWYTLSFVNQQ